MMSRHPEAVPILPGYASCMPHRRSTRRRILVASLLLSIPVMMLACQRRLPERGVSRIDKDSADAMHQAPLTGSTRCQEAPREGTASALDGVPEVPSGSHWLKNYQGRSARVGLVAIPVALKRFVALADEDWTSQGWELKDHEAEKKEAEGELEMAGRRLVYLAQQAYCDDQWTLVQISMAP